MRAQLRMNRRTTIALAIALLATATAVARSPAAAATRVDRGREVVHAQARRTSDARECAPYALTARRAGGGMPRAGELAGGAGVRVAVAALRRGPAVDYAAPN